MDCGTNEVDSKKSFKNGFGELNGIYLFIRQKEQTIKAENIIKIRFIKKQKYDFNCLAFLVAVLLLFFIKDDSGTQPIPIQILFVLLSLFFFACSLFFKSFNYTFLVLIKNHTFIAIDVSKKLSQEAENLASQFNKSIAKTAKAPGISN
jgi:hypothetical protein